MLECTGLRLCGLVASDLRLELQMLLHSVEHGRGHERSAGAIEVCETLPARCFARRTVEAEGKGAPYSKRRSLREFASRESIAVHLPISSAQRCVHVSR